MNTHSKYITTTQTGSALVVSLMILLVMTLIGVTAMSGSNLEEKMSGNTRDTMLAFQASEAALRGGERVVANLVTTAPFAGCSSTYTYALGCRPDVTSAATWTNAATYSGAIDKIKTLPKYIIEYTGVAPGSPSLTIDNYGDNSLQDITTFRITARGTGGTDSAVVLLESYVGKQI